MSDDFWLSTLKQKLLKLAKLNKKLIEQPTKPGIQPTKATLRFVFSSSVIVLYPFLLSG